MLPTLLRPVLGLSLLAAAARAQTSDTWLSDRINGAALIRVSGRWGTRYLVQPHFSGGALTFAQIEPPDSVPTPLRLDGVERIQVRGSAAGTGALIGAGIGFAGGLAAGIGLTSALCNDGLGCSNEGGGTALVVLVSTAGGALLGALIGSVSRKWETIYSSKPDQPSGLP